MPGLRLWGLTNEAESGDRAWKYRIPLMEPSCLQSPSLSQSTPTHVPEYPSTLPTYLTVPSRRGSVDEWTRCPSVKDELWICSIFFVLLRSLETD